MDARRAILIYHYADRIKSELLIAARLHAEMDLLSGERRAGAEKLMQAYFQALSGEIKIAQNIEKSVNLVGAERKVMEARGHMRLGYHKEVSRCISEAISLITTLCQASMEALVEKDLI